MTDPRLAELFAEGTAPERDAAFARRVDARIRRARLGRILLAHAVRPLALLALAAAVLEAARAIEPTLQRIAERSPQLMGVPLPLVMAVLAAGLAAHAGRLVLRRRRG